MNTMTIDGVTFELILHGQGCTDVPSVVHDGKAYIGQAIIDKQRLFKIEDGDAKEGQLGYAIHPQSSYGWNIINEWKLSLNVSSEVKQFHFLSNAREWLLMNQPCLSVNDILNMGISFSDYAHSEFKELAKKKINATT